MAPDPVLEDSRWPSAELLQLLQSHVPRALSLLRRLQFASQPGGSTEHTRVLFAHDGAAGRDAPFAAAYVDVSRGPETEVWLYASAEAALARDAASPAEADACHALVLAVLRRAKRRAAEYERAGGRLFRPHGLLVGALDERLLQLLRARGVTTSYHNPTDKFLFRAADLPARDEGDTALEAAGMHWDVVRRADMALIISRTNIPKVEKTLMLLPSAAARLPDEAPAAWAFVSLDGTLSTLHCEEPYRRRGIARAVATRVMRDFGARFDGGGGWCAADVTVGNLQSQGLLESLGGRLAWRMSWSVVDFDNLGEPI